MELDDASGAFEFVLGTDRWVEGLDVGVRPALDVGRRGARQAELVCDHVDGQQQGELGQEVRLTSRGESVDEFAHVGVEIAVQALDGRARKQALHNAAKDRVPRWIDLAQYVGDHPPLAAIELIRGRHVSDRHITPHVDLARKGFPVERCGHDVLVPRNEVQIHGRIVVDRSLSMQRGVHRIGALLYGGIGER